MAISTTINRTTAKKIFLFTDTDIIVCKGTFELPPLELFASLTEDNQIKYCIQENSYIAAFLKDDFKVPEQYELATHRAIFAAELEWSNLSARARAILNWRKNKNFCSKCGEKLIDCTDESACECPKCKARFYPQNSPCIIVQVYKGEKQLLANHTKHRASLYTCIAGFLEPGETVEEAVIREVKEETSLTVNNVKYIESQTWPFPHQLMLGCTAEWVSGEIAINKEELADAQWFSPDNLPEIPTPGTLARRLILLREQ